MGGGRVTTFPRSRCERDIADARRRLRAGEISADTARELSSRARAAQADRIRRAALDAAIGGA